MLKTENYELQFWRTSSKIKVDFVIYGPDCFLAIEVKNKKILNPSDLKGLKLFGQDYPEATLLLLCRDERTYLDGSILCIPVDYFLKNIRPDNPLPKN